MADYRIEADTLGDVKIPQTALWGPQTERSRHNFPTGALMPLDVIKAMLNIKKQLPWLTLNREILKKRRRT